jgi:hypothetical protein
MSSISLNHSILLTKGFFLIMIFNKENKKTFKTKKNFKYVRTQNELKSSFFFFSSFASKYTFCRAWCHMPIIPALRKLRQEDCEFQASLGYTA